MELRAPSPWDKALAPKSGAFPAVPIGFSMIADARNWLKRKPLQCGFKSERRTSQQGTKEKREGLFHVKQSLPWPETRRQLLRILRNANSPSREPERP